MSRLISPEAGDFVHYLNWDPHRKHKDRAVVIYVQDAASAKSRFAAVRTPAETGHGSSQS